MKDFVELVAAGKKPKREANSRDDGDTGGAATAALPNPKPAGRTKKKARSSIGLNAKRFCINSRSKV